MADLPDSVNSLFTSREEEISSTEEVVDTDIETQDAELVVADKAEEITPQTVDISKVDYDRVVRQRDAVIREKQRTAAEKREFAAKIKELEDKLSNVVTPASEVKEPDPKVNPVAYLEFKNQQKVDALKAELEALKGTVETRTKEFSEQSLQRDMVNFVTQDETRFKTQHADFDAAMQHFDKSVFVYCLSKGCSEEEAITATETFKGELLMHFLKSGASPAQGFYDYTKGLGFKSNGEPDPRILAANKGRAASSALTAGSRGNGALTGAPGSTVTVEDYRTLPVNSEVRLRIASDKGLFRQLYENGEVVIPS